VIFNEELISQPTAIVDTFRPHAIGDRGIGPRKKPKVKLPIMI